MKKERGQTAVEVEARDAQAEPAKPKARHARNNVRKIREALLLSKAEFARKAGLSPLTIDRIESGYSCRLDTKRKIILALGLKVSEKEQVFDEEDEESEG